jgi:homoserine dehydrogenase
MLDGRITSQEKTIMRNYRLALIGFGNVGQGLAQIIVERGDEIARQYGAQISVVAVSDKLKGSLYDPNGLDLAKLLGASSECTRLEELPAPQHGWDALQTIQNSNADIIAEVSYTDLNTGQPATGHIEAALRAGKHVITTNKGPIALHYPRLMELARQNKVEIGAEGTVMSGTPTLRLGMELLAGSGIRRIQGILNGTTNYILSRMADGVTYGDALASAQELGYAEADPTGDVEGIDAAGKVVILANLLMGANLTLKDVDRQGISHLTLEDVQKAQQANQRWKLIGSVERQGDQVKASVRPTSLSIAHPLAGINGATNAVTYTTDLLGDVTLIGPGAGRLETGFALLGDLLAIHRKLETHG